MDEVCKKIHERVDEKLEDKFENHQKRLDKYSDGLLKCMQTYLEKNI